MEREIDKKRESKEREIDKQRKRQADRERQADGELVSRCFKPNQPQRITSGLTDGERRRGKETTRKGETSRGKETTG